MSVSAVQAQYQILTDVPVQHPETDGWMQFPFSGGFNNPQFSSIDFSGDGLPDLFIFDRSGNTVTVLERISGPDADPVFGLSTAYDSGIPALKDWAMLYDFNCDNLPDLFTYLSGSAAVYQADMDASGVSFSLLLEEMTYTTSFEIPIYTSRTDLPGLADVDGDGDMYVLAFSVTGSQMRWFENKSNDLGYGCDSLIFVKADDCWGNIFEEESCDGAILGATCLGISETADEQRLHVGSTILVFDRDKDGDQDLVLGDVSCDNLVYYENGGSPLTANMVSKDPAFPDSDVPAIITEFPGAYLVDMDLDGALDLLVAPNDDQLSVNRYNILEYENMAVTDTLQWQYKGNNYFTANTIDVGEYAKPVWMDVDGDGLLDIVVGTGSSFEPGMDKRYGLWLYTNIGTATEPAFALTDMDYAGWSLYEKRDLVPAAGDWDNDGDIDMILGHFDGTLSYMENTAGAGNPAIWAAPILNFYGIDVGQNAAPCMYDADGNGTMDLIVGEQNGNLNYFEHSGSGVTLISENWGGVDVRTTGDVVGYSVPRLLHNEAGVLELLVGCVHGSIYRYTDITDNFDGTFNLADSAYLGYNRGMFSAVDLADINGDGKMEWMAGNIRGGLVLFRPGEAVGITDNAALDNSLHLYPNPVGDYLQIDGPPGEGVIINLNGQVVRTFYHDGTAVAVGDLSPGLYYLTLTATSERWVAPFVKR